MVRVRAPISTTRPSASCRMTTRLASHARRCDVSYETCGPSGGLLHEHDLVAQLLEAAEVVAAEAGCVAPVEVIGPEILMGHAVLEHMPQGYEHRVLHGHDRLFGAAAGFQPVV